MTGHDREQCRFGNVLMDLAWECVKIQLVTKCGRTWALFEHPEDLGKCWNGNTPATAWRHPGVRTAVQAGAVTAGILQSAFGTDYDKPTRLAGKWPGLDQHGANRTASV